MQDLKVALVHDWLTGMRAAEAAPEKRFLCIVPRCRYLYLAAHQRERVSHNRAPPDNHQFYPVISAGRALLQVLFACISFCHQRFRLQSYDLVLSSSHCVAKGIRPPAGAKHLCYIHSPMRYVWDQFDNYAQGGRSGAMARVSYGAVRARLQAWDVASAVRVDQFVANSHNIAAKVQRYYN